MPCTVDRGWGGGRVGYGKRQLTRTVDYYINAKRRVGTRIIKAITSGSNDSQQIFIKSVYRYLG